MKKRLTQQDLIRFDSSFTSKKEHIVAMNAATSNGLCNAARNVNVARNNPMEYSIDVESGKVCNQKASGRCWMFASLNVMRLDVMKKLNLENMELSQTYPLFYDKLERSNYFLENIIATLDEETDSRVVHHFLTDPIGDGGQWDMFRSIVAKYGVVPKDVMPETENSSATRELNTYLAKKLREFACNLREAYAAGKKNADLRTMKESMMNTVYRMLAITLGKPPVRFTWETRDKDKNFVKVENITPQDFFKQYVGWDLGKYVTVINAPTADKEYYKTFTVQYLGSVYEGEYPVKYLNLPMDELRALTIKQLKDGKVVWFGSDVGQFSNRKTGYLTLDAYDMQSLLDTEFGMNKAQRLDYCESLMTHAMVITGVDLDGSGKPLRWKVENSWGKDVGRDGYYVMSDEWFGEFAYQILLEKKYLTKKQAKAFEQEPIELKPWDPMGSLAL